MHRLPRHRYRRPPWPSSAIDALLLADLRALAELRGMAVTEVLREAVHMHVHREHVRMYGVQLGEADATLMADAPNAIYTIHVSPCRRVAEEA